MRQSLTDIFFALLRAALDAGQGALVGQGAPADHNTPAEQFAERPPFAEPLSGDDWKQIFSLSKKQALLGVIYSAVQRLPQDLQPPKELMEKWNQIVRQIIIRNNRMNATAANITRMFAERGASTLILKGQANALLYPEPLLRQSGDIDILVEGGRRHVLNLLREMNVMDGVDISEVSNLHVHLDSGRFSGVAGAVSSGATQNVIPASEPGSLFPGITIEVHFAPSYNNSPITTRALCEFCAQQTSAPGAVQHSVEGFNCPPATFALTMQLSHLLRHFYGEGIGLRQLADYYLLLTHSTQADRDLVRANLRKMGLYHIAGAVMHVLARIFELPETLMLCKPDQRRGEQLFENILAGGNFGHYSREQKLPVFNRWLADRLRPLRRLTFDIPEAVWHEYRYVGNFIRYMPKRIKHRKISVRKVK